MARIKLGPIVSDISGSVKEVIHVPWKRSQYAVKSRAGIYANPQSPLQAQIRRFTQDGAFAWKNLLTENQRQKWDEYARGLQRRDANAGGIRNLIPQNRGIMSGYHAFLKGWVQVYRCWGLHDARLLDSPLSVTPPSAVAGLGAVWVPETIPNFSLDFDGVNEYISLGNVLNYDYYVPQSWEFWVRTTQPLVNDTCVRKDDAAAQDGYQLFDAGKVFYWQIMRASAAEGLWVSRAFDVPNIYHHIVCTYDGSNNANGMRIYVDNVVGQVIGGNVPITGTIISSQPLVFMGKPGFPATFAIGRLDCTRNYNRVVTPVEVNTLWNAGAGLYGADPFSDASCQGAWMFCTGSGITLFDISGNGYDGTLQNMEPGDWQAGHVPCPTVPAHISLTWDDPVTMGPAVYIRIWIRSRELGVHKQLVACISRDVETAQITQVRMSQGVLHTITDFPGHYLIQADAVSIEGVISPPSNTVEVVVT